MCTLEELAVPSVGAVAWLASSSRFRFSSLAILKKVSATSSVVAAAAAAVPSVEHLLPQGPLHVGQGLLFVE